MRSKTFGGLITLLFFIAVAGFLFFFLQGQKKSKTTESSPHRIVSLGHTGVYETLLDFGLYDKIIAVPKLCEYPGSESKIHLQTSEDGLPNIEAILALNPDLVIIPEPVRPALERVGLRVVGMPPEGTFDKLDDFVLRLGKALQQPERAQQLVSHMQSGRARIESRTKGLKPVRIYYEHPSAFKTYGKHTFASQLIRLCGGINIAEEIELLKPLVNAEFVVAADPEVLLLGAFTDTQEEVVKRPGWNLISAVKNGRIGRIRPDDRLLWSTRMAERAERLLLPLLHPELAPLKTENTAKTPQRIVVMGHTGVYETLLDFGMYEQIIAVPEFCRYPGSESKIKLKHPTDGQTNVEAILALHPDLVVTRESFAAPLERIGLQVVKIPDDGSAIKLEWLVVNLGKALNKPQRAEELVEHMHQAQAKLEVKTKGLKPVRVYYEEPSPYKTHAKYTLETEMIRICGGVNIADEITLPNPTVNSEFIVSANPDVIVLGAFTDPPEEVMKRPGWNMIPAVKNGRVFQIRPEDRLLCSTRFVERAERLLLPWMHPDFAKEASK